MAAAHFLSRLLTLGGDDRITVPGGQNTNRYGASPFPRSTLGYASSTANDISLPAFRHLAGLMTPWPEDALSDDGFYVAALEGMRGRIRQGWGLDKGTAIVFAPSGTDLEYVPLALAGGPVVNVLIGADEVGSGCVLSAAGRYFADRTAVAERTEKGAVVEGLEGTGLVDIAVRETCGRPRSSADITRRIEDIASTAHEEGRDCLVHVVYGSKTGLVLPDLADLDRLRARHPGMRFVVDACQARLSPGDLGALIERGCIVLLTGSKFMGGPPFSGMALVPAEWTPPASLAPGLAAIFRRGEWPADWRACNHLPRGANPGLLLRLEAALFELERFRALDEADVREVIAAFARHVALLSDALGTALVSPCLTGGGLHTSTLATLNLSVLPSAPDIAVAQRWHRVLAARGLRLGQPVKCIPLPGGGWGGTLRLSLSMPLIAELSCLSPGALEARLSGDMGMIRSVLSAAQKGAA